MGKSFSPAGAMRAEKRRATDAPVGIILIKRGPHPNRGDTPHDRKKSIPAAADKTQDL